MPLRVPIRGIRNRDADPIAVMSTSIPIVPLSVVTCHIPCLDLARDPKRTLDLSEVVLHSQRIAGRMLFSELPVLQPLYLNRKLLHSVPVVQGHALYDHLGGDEIATIPEEFYLFKGDSIGSWFSQHIVCGLAGLYYDTELEKFCFPFTFPTPRGVVGIGYIPIDTPINQLSEEYGGLECVMGMFA